MDTDTPFTRLYEETIPSVVSVYRTHASGAPVRGAGSGFIYDEAGYVVTNEHVLGRGGDVELRFSDGDWRTGRVAGDDAYTDLAVVFVDDLPDAAVPLPVARRNPRPGEPVAAFGNPMGLDGTMTTGVVSGTSRSSPSGNGFAIPDTIQTDAAVNPGNSGGPLVRLDGTVVGVNRARTGDNIGFAISPRILNRVLPSLIEQGSHDHPYLSIRTIDVSPTVADANGLDAPGGVLVVDAPSGPGAHGLRGCPRRVAIHDREVPVGGDVIVGVDGHRIDSHEELMRYLVTETSPGEEIDVEVIRNGVTETETLALGARPRVGRRGRQIPIE